MQAVPPQDASTVDLHNIRAPSPSICPPVGGRTSATDELLNEIYIRSWPRFRLLHQCPLPWGTPFWK